MTLVFLLSGIWPGQPARAQDRVIDQIIGVVGNNIILKSVMHELALAIDEPLISTAHAAGTDRQALRLARELEARTLERAENQPSA